MNVLPLLLMVSISEPALPPVQVTDVLCFPRRAVVHATWEGIGRAQSAIYEDTCMAGAATTRQATILDYLDRVYPPWNTLDDATMYAQYADTYPGNRDYYIPKALEKLRELRDMIGAEAYYRGQMPEPIPFGLFERCED